MDTKIVKKVPVECYTRVCGYYRPVAQANPGKRAEISERAMFNWQKFLNREG